MELTIDQALQQGVAAHKEGKLQDAERLYRAILQAQPDHPDANHNLGVLAVSVGKPLEAIPLFKLAVDANPKIEQFWLSYTEVLIKLEHFDTAGQVLIDAEQSGVSAEKLDVFHRLLRSNAPSATNKAASAYTLSEKRKKLAQKKKSKKRRAQSASAGAEPSHDQINCLMGHYQAKRLAEAEAVAMSLTQQFPNHSFGWKALGALLKQTGRLNDSLFPMQKSVELSPYDEEAHSNLGNTLKELGRLDEAEARYKKAIALKSDYADAHYNLGVILQELNRLEKAEASYRKAIALKPDLAQAYINLGLVLKDLGRLDEAISTYVQAINSKVDVHDAFTGLGAALKGARFSEGNKSLYPILMSLLTARNFVRPSTVAPAILSLLMKDDRIECLLTNPPTFANIKQVHRVIKTLAQVPLLHELMRICPLPELQFEVVFVSIRRVLLSSLRQIQASPELIYFLSTLSLHCFTNEYIYFETEEEATQVSILERSISEIMAQAGQPDILEILCLATYRPLHQYDWSEKLRVLKELPEVQLRLIEEPQAERAIARSTLLLASVSDAVSRKVREQYEVNPYPRWVGLAIPSKAKSVAEVCAEVKLKLQSDSIKSVGAPSILIAGCGTGQHSIETACRYAKCNVTAVDLSLASLAYAQRKLSEFRINNSEYIQADILNLEELGREFDIIESLGVLHHMDDPMAGWRVLVNLLKTGGLMKIGLYSELARHNIAQIREEIAAEGISTSEAEIRQFRQSLVESRLAHHQRMTDFDDFFSFSMFRDLVFHVQEHCFTLPQIKGCLSELGLKFCGFESAEAVTRFKKFHGEESDTCDLMLWHDFEQSNSRTFEGMYQFWCQKV